MPETNSRAFSGAKGILSKAVSRTTSRQAPVPLSSHESDPENADEKPRPAAEASRLNSWRVFAQKSPFAEPSEIVALPPDGGRQAWMTVVTAHMSGLCTWGLVNSFGVLQTHYVQLLDRPPSDISWIGSIQSFFLFFLGAVSGRLLDAGYFHQTIAIGTLLLLLGIFGASVSTTYLQILITHGFCVGLGGGLLFAPSVSIVGTYFSKKQSLAMSLVACSSSVGGLIFAAMFQNLLPAVGFAWSMRIAGFLIMSVMVPANLVLRPRRLARKSGPLVEWAAFKELPYSFFAFGMCLVLLGMWVPVFYLGSFARNVIHVSDRDANSLILIINGVGLAGRIIPTLLVHRLGPVNLIVPLSLLASAVLFTWAAVTTHAGLVVFDVFYGLLLAAAQGMFPPSLGSLTTDLSRMGVRVGMVFTVVSVPLLVGTPIAGAIIASPVGYLGAQLYAGAAMLAGTCLLAAARFSQTGWQLRVRV